MGATVNYIAATFQDKESKPPLGIEISSQARYYQICHQMSHEFIYSLNEEWQDYVLEAALVNHQLAKDPLHNELIAKKNGVTAGLQSFLDKQSRNYEKMILPSFILNKLNIQLKEVIGLAGSLVKHKLPVDRFILEALDEVVNHYKGKPEQFILTVEDLATQPSSKEQKLSWEQLEMKSQAILGSDAPLAVQKRVKARLVDGESSSGHALYLSLADSYELQDPNLPGYKGLSSSNLENFKLLLLAWFSRFPYQTVSGLYRAVQ